MSINFNPYLTNQPQNSFLLETQGYIQGLAQDDPSYKNWLASGILATTETLPMWGGVPIQEYINVNGVNSESLGPTVARATAAPASGAGSMTGMAVFNQAAHMVITPGNTVPLASVSNGVNFYRFGSQARIPVQLDPALVTALQATPELITQEALYWSTANYYVTLTATSNFALTGVRLLSVNTNSKIVSWNGTAASWTAGPAGIIQL
jgi:hypothetical protein